MAFESKPRQEPVASIASEQAILGAILFDNSVYVKVSAFLKPQHFFEPAHGAIYEAAGTLIGAGRLCSPVALSAHLGGSGADEYLSACAGNVPAMAEAAEYGLIVFEKALLRGLGALGEDLTAEARGSTVARPMPEILADADRRFRELCDFGAVRRAERLGFGAAEWLTEAEAVTGALPGVTTGLRDLDTLIGGFQAGDLFVLAGRPSMGKSAFALSVARAAAVHCGVHISSLEMSRKQLWQRMLADVSRETFRVPYSQIGRRVLFPDEADALHAANAAIRDMNIMADDASGVSVEDVAASARRSERVFAAKGKSLGLIVVDYLQLMPLDRAFAGSPALAIGLQTKALKTLAKDLDCCVLLLSQLSRAVETRDDKRPGMADLRQSGEIEQDADIIGFILRPEYYVERKEGATDEERAEARGKLKLFVDKNRNGPTGVILLDCDVAANSVRDRARLYPDTDRFSAK